MSTLLEGRGNKRIITCPYHGWSYETDGKLRGAPAMSGNEGFCKENYRLPQVKCEVWLGWVLVSLNPDAKPVAEHFAEVEELIRPYRHGKLHRVVQRKFRLGHQLEGAGREFHGKLPPARLPCRHHRRLVEARRDDLPDHRRRISTGTRS